MAFNITSSPTNAEILASLLGDTTGLSNIQITTNGNPLAVGLFQDSPVNLGSGVVLSTGQADRLVGANTSDRNNISTVFNGLGTVPNGNDVITFEITFDADAVDRQLFLQYVFGSEEFLDFAGNSFNDRLTFELNGVNLATLNNGSSVDVNSLTPSAAPNTFSPDYIDNLGDTNSASQTTLDGYTVPLTFRGNLVSNASNRLVITIQDIGDGAVDSAVFLAAGSLGVSNPNIPTINVTAESPGNTNEDSTGGIFYTFTRTGATNQALSVNYQLGGTATFDTDYSSINFPTQNGAITFAAGSASTTLFVSPTIDALVEGDETVIVNLLPANNAEYVIGSARSAGGNILDEDTPLNNISLTVLPTSTIEDTEISGNLIYTFTRTGPTNESLRVDFNVGGTALFSDDYDVTNASFFQGSVGSITFDVGSDTARLAIDPRADDITESPETVELTLTPSRFDNQLGGRSRSYIIDTPSAVTGNIIDTPSAVTGVSLFVDPNIVNENGQTNLSYIFTRTGSITLPLTIRYFVRGTANLGEDYTAIGADSFDDTIGSVTFQAGSNTAVVEIAPTPDSVLESEETVILQLDSIDGALGGYNINTFAEAVGTIVDSATPSLPIINIVVEPQSITENGQTSLLYVFSRSGSITNELTVNYNIGGTAAFGADYSQNGATSFTDTTGSITFAANSNTATLSIAAATDAVVETDETVSLTLIGNSNYAIGSNSSSTGTIVDTPVIEPPTVSLALNRASVNEDGTANLSYTFTRTGPTGEALNVRYRITGTAIENTDYNTLGTSPPNDGDFRILNFAAGASTFTIRVDPTLDDLVEGDETVSLTLLPAGNAEYTVANANPVIGTIIDAALPLPVIDVTLSPASVNEGGQSNLIYLFTRTGSITQPLTINYSIGGTAAFTADYNQLGASNFTNTTGSITFAANSATATLEIAPATDTIAEPDEIVTLNLVGDSAYTIGSNSSASGTITDTPPVVVITPPTINLAVNPDSVNEDGTANLVYTFSRTGSTGEALTVRYRVDGTASSSEDYTIGSVLIGTTATVTFSVGANTATVFVDPRPDTLLEADETVTLALIPAASGQYIVGTSAVTGTILDQDTALNNISLAVSPSQIAEDGAENLIYTFTRTGSTTEALRVDYDFGGNAIFGTDYIVTGANSLGSISSGVVTFNVGTVNFVAGSDIATVIVDPTTDLIAETNENISIRLVASRNDSIVGGGRRYNISTPDAISGTIIEPIVVPIPNINIILEPASVREGEAQTLTYRFTRTEPIIQPLTVNYSVGGSAIFGADYNQTGATNFDSTTGSITFAANSAEAILVISSTADSLLEQNEVVTLNLLDNSTYTIGNNSSASGTIVDVPVIVTTPPTINLTVNPASASEDAMTNLAYTFTRNGSVQDPLTVTYRVGGTANRLGDVATATSDYVLNTSVAGSIHTVTFGAGSDTATVFATPTSDRIIEGDETVELTLVPDGSSQYIIGTTAAVIGTIVDQDDNSVSLAVSPGQVAEDGTENLIYTFARTGSTTQVLEVDYEFGGNATFGTDYIVAGANSSGTVTLNIGTVNFAAGSNTATVTVDPTADSIAETNENITLRLIPSRNDTIFGGRTYNIATPDAISGTITEPVIEVPRISVSLEPTSVNEDGTTNLVYTFTRTGSTTEVLQVDYSVGGTASLGSDYSALDTSNFQSTSGSINFAVGETTATIVIDPTPDAITESNETVELTLIGAGYGSPIYIIDTPGTIVGTIVEPAPVVNLPPTQIIFNGGINNNTFSIAENTNTANRVRIADIVITDDQLGTNNLSLSGIDAGSFELSGTTLFLRSGVTLDFETRTNYNLVVSVDDVTVGNTPDVINNFTLIVTDINEPPTGAPIIPIGSTTQNTPIQIPRSTFLTGFTDVENDPLNIVNLVVSNGTIVNNNDGIFTLTPTVDFSGQINITYGVTDGVNVLTGQLRSVVVSPPENGLNFIGTTNLDVGIINNLTNGIFAVNPNNINLVGDEINLVGGANSVTVPGKTITLQPDRSSQAIQIGSNDSNNVNILDLTPTDLAAIADGFSKIIIGRASGTGNIEINSNVTFRDPILLQSPGGQLNITASISLTDNASLDFNVQTLIKSGSSILTINGNTATTFIGNTTINGGVLLLAKSPNTEALNNAPISVNSGTLQLGSNEQINNVADLTLNGGSFSLNGFNETLDRLQVTNNSIINLGNGSSKLAFGNSSTANWTGILSIENWSNTSGGSIRFGNSANGLTPAQLNNIQFVGFGRGANINVSGFLTPVGITVVNPTPDQDGVNDDIEDLAANDGDGNFDGIRDSLQENVASILNLGGANVNSIATVIAQAGARISGLRSLATPITTANLTSLANPIEFKIAGLANGASTTIEYLIAKADQNRQYNSYVMFGPTADNLTPHAHEFLYNGQTGAELFDTNGDGLTDKAIVHFVDGLRGDSDLTINGEIQDPGAPGFTSIPVGLSNDANNVVQITGTAGAAIASFSLVANQTRQVSEVGFFRIDGANTVRGIAANAAGFARTALQSGQVIFSSLADNLLSTADISRQLQLSAGDRLGFYLVQNGTVDAALQRNDFSNVVFSLDQANPAGRRVLEVATESNGSYRLKWEQGSAEVNDDLILNLQLQNAPLNNQNLVASIQGDRESELLDLSSFTGRDVQVTFTIRREAAFNNTVGFYQVEDAQGTVTSITGVKIKPGEAGYQAAVVQNRIAGVDLAVANGQTTSIDAVLRGGAIYAPFLIANANPSSLNGNFSNVYTSYTVGNADITDHVRLLGDNTFGFEDLVGAGDRDFNDVVLKAVFRNS